MTSRNSRTRDQASLRDLCLLFLLPFLCLMSSATAQTSISSTYPEVWDWFPSKPPTQAAFVNLRWLPDGDVLVTYHNGERGIASRRHDVGFFSRREFAKTEDAFDGRFPPPDGKHRVTLPNGSTVTGTAQGECSRGLGSQVVVHNKSGHQIARKSVLVLLDPPRKNPAARCEEREQAAFSSSLVFLRPTALLALADNTFLVADLITGAVLRLDTDLSTRSQLVGRRLSVRDTGELEQLVRKYWLPSPEYGVDWVRFFDDLRGSLIRGSRTNMEPNRRLLSDAKLPPI